MLGLLCLAAPAAAEEAAPSPPPVADTAGPPEGGAAAAEEPPPFDGNAELKAKLDATGRLTIAGDRLRVDLLRRFYATQGYKTVWDTHPAQAASLWKAVLRADRHGLDPALFHRALLSERGDALSPVDRDLVRSDAFLSYADALHRGAVPIEQRYDDEDLRPEPVDVAAVLAAAIDSPDAARPIEALAPTSPEYRAMLHAYAQNRAIAEGGSPPAAAAAQKKGVRIADGGRAAAEKRARLLQINLERLRWLPRQMPADRIVVNAAVAELRLYRANRPAFTTRVIVGQTSKQTPELQSTVSTVLFNPPWNVPRSIFDEEILPKLRGDPGYLSRHHMRWRGNSVQQEAGPYSALGRLKFEMPDRYDVYLHDTPERWRFRAADRMVSHGCVRVENPQALAALILDMSPEAIAKAIAVGHSNRRSLPTPLPIFILYQTAFVESDGSIAYRADPYGRDDEIWRRLNRAPPAPMAQESAGSQRKG
jgi:murein L,D-transpeptidase YcbB/YkuD